ncbi:fumarylacetoacetate hydrolase family protein, partial [Kribbella sp. NPDC050820]|uniref:fumarylacetoacetate hydrolase family protein n=1 Tax=Kribbella sp. NPDC050820 TaxID=3155408 RepID=UPI00340861A3
DQHDLLDTGRARNPAGAVPPPGHRRHGAQHRAGRPGAATAGVPQVSTLGHRPGEAIELEAGRHHHIDAEAELAVVIGTPARNLTRDNALTAVFGYTCANDVTDRTAQAADSLWTTAKSRDTYTPLGPWIRTDLDPSDVAVQLGDDTGLGPQASTAGLARGVADTLAYISVVMTLHPGDVVLCGAAAKNHSSGTPRTRLRRPQSRLTTRQRELYALWQKELGPRSGIAGCRGSVALACAV